MVVKLKCRNEGWEVRRSEEEVCGLGELELRLRDQEGERKKRETKRERQRRYIERI